MLSFLQNNFVLGSIPSVVLFGLVVTFSNVYFKKVYIARRGGAVAWSRVRADASFD
jgi:hypothetical protein